MELNIIVQNAIYMNLTWVNITLGALIPISNKVDFPPVVWEGGGDGGWKGVLRPLLEKKISINFVFFKKLEKLSSWKLFSHIGLIDVMTGLKSCSVAACQHSTFLYLIWHVRIWWPKSLYLRLSQSASQKEDPHLCIIFQIFRIFLTPTPHWHRTSPLPGAIYWNVIVALPGRLS